MNEIKIELVPVLERIGAFVKREAVRMCPVDMGDLRSSIDFRTASNTVTVFSTSSYAAEMEYGRPPEPLSDTEKEDVTKWAERHGASPKGMIKYLEKEGIKVGTKTRPAHITSYGRDSYRPFLRPAAYQNLPEIVGIIKRYFE